MARILYGLCGMNLGHVSRAVSVGAGLVARGHDVAFAGGGAARDVAGALAMELGARLEPRSFEVPVVRQVVDGGRLAYGASLRCNVASVLGASAIVAGLSARLRAWAPDLVISDYEPFSARAAERLGIPVVSLDHQHAVTELDFAVPPRFRLEALLTGAVIRRVAARRPARVVVTSFFRAPVRDPARTSLVGPILRRSVLAARPEVGGHTLVYVNQGDGRALLDVLRRVGEPFVVHGGELTVAPGVYGRVTVKARGSGFLEDLATARAVVCTAGHTLISEALHLGKPVLALPLGGTFEQTQNALALARAGLGEAVFGRPPLADELCRFLRRAEGLRARLPLQCPGNDDALALVEASLATRAGAPCGCAMQHTHLGSARRAA